MPGSTLIFGWGNPSRGDDALGPMFVDRIEAMAQVHPDWGEICFQTDFQLQVEHALDLRRHARVLFVDASSSCPPPFQLLEVHPSKDKSFSTHSMSPAAVLQVYCEIERNPPPPACLLAIRGNSFELGEPLGIEAGRNLIDALAWAEIWLRGCG